MEFVKMHVCSITDSKFLFISMGGQVTSSMCADMGTPCVGEQGPPINMFGNYSAKVERLCPIFIPQIVSLDQV